MNKIRLYIVSLGLLLSGALALNAFTPSVSAAQVRDCDSNAIIYCGALSQQELLNKYNQNSPGDLPAIFSHYGISKADLAGGTIKQGVIYKNGEIKVDGKVVATGAHSVGRHNMPGSRAITINGKTYYERTDTRNFQSPSIEAFVIMKNGKFYRAVMKSCGNPVVATPTPEPPKPEFECVNLTVTEITRTKRRFTAEATASGGATIEKYEFGFGDGMGITVTDKSYTYDYKKTGTFTASVVVHVKVNGEIKKVTSPACKKPVTINDEKIKVCELATKQLITINKSEFDATKHSMNLNDCKVVPPTPADIQVCELATKNIITIKDNEFDASKHSKDLNNCKEVPQVLASTGPEAIIGGLFGSSALGYGAFSYFQSRRHLIDKLLGRR